MPVRSPQENSAVARWVKLSLTERYAATLREPVPDALLRLLDDDSK